MTDIRIIPAQGAINVTGSVNFRGTNNSSVLFLTGSGGAGLGTTSPDSELHIVGSQTRFVTLDRSGTRSYDIGINSSKTLLITDNSAEADRIALTLSGSVGIGVTNPTNQLQLYGPSSGNGTTFEIGNSYGESPKTILFTNTTADVGKIEVNGRNQAISNMPYMAFSLWDSTSTSVEERMRINREGNVGIGTTNPGANLHVSESIRIGYPTGRLYAQATDVFYGEITPFNINGRMIFNVNYPGGNIVFQSGSQEVARFKDGYLGIGTTGPSYHLDIDAGGKVPARFRSSADAQIIVQGSNTWAGIQFSDANDSDYIWYRGSTETFAIGGGGSTVSGKKLHIHGGATVGSGYAAHVMPTNGLSVEGGVEIGGDLTVDGIVTAQEFHTTFVSASIIFSSGSTLFGDDANDIHQFTGSIVQSGGTTTVGDKLYLTNVASSGQDGILAFDSTNTTGGSRIFSFTRGGSNELKYHSYGYHRWYSGPASGTSDSTARMTLNSDGNLGIGTTAPAQKLDVRGNIRVGDGHFIGNETTYDNLLLQSSTGENIVVSSAESLFFKTGGTGPGATGDTRLFVSSSGNVGIGSNAPTSRLNVKSTNSSVDQITLTHSGNTVKIVALGQESSHGSLILRANSGINKVRLSAAGNNSYILDSNVGIGTPSPASKFHISGSNSDLFRIQSSTGEADVRYISTPNNSDWQVGTGYGAAPGGGTSFFFYQGGGTKASLHADGQLSLPQYGSGTHTGTAAYRLSVDSSGNIIEEGLGAGAVDGAGQANRLAKWVDSDTLTSSSINVSADNKTVDHYSYQNLAQLNIGRTSSERVNLYVDDNDIIFTATQDSDGDATHEFIMNRQFGGTGGNNFKIQKDGTSQVTVDSSGNLSVDTDGSSVVIGGNSSGGQLRFGSNNNNNAIVYGSSELQIRTQQSNGITFYTDGPTKRMTITDDGDVKVGSTTTGLSLEESGNDYLIKGVDVGGNAWNSIHLQADSLDGLYIQKDTNNIGIGTTSPREKLEVDGQAFLHSGLFQVSETDHTDISSGNEYINHTGPIRIDGSGAAISSYGSFKGYQAVYGSGSHGWDAYTQGAYAHPILEYYSGNNGSHSFPAGSALSPGYLYQFVKGPDFSGTGAGAAITSSNSELVWGITDDKYGYFANRIGIGTDSPSYAVHVENNSVYITGGTGNSKWMRYSVNDSWAYWTTNVGKYYLNAEVRVDGGRIGSYNEDLSLRTSGNTKVTIQDVTGNVGIGTTSPTGSLHIATGGENNDSAILIEVDDTKYRRIQFSEDFSTWGPSQYGAYLGYDANSNVFSIGTYNGGTDKRTLNILRGSDRVGIGLTSPSYALEVAGGGDNVIAGFQSTDNRASIVIQDNDTTSYIGSEDSLLYFNRGTGNGISSAVNNGMVIDGNGNVGIGTSNVDAKLHISSSIPNAIRIETEEHGEVTPQLYIEGNKIGSAPALSTAIELKSNNDYRGRGVLFTVANSTTEWYAGVPYAGSGFQIGYDATGKQLPYYNTSSSLFINTNGNVGIGTSNPTTRLTVYKDEDESAEIGRAHIGFVGWGDYAGFSHIDRNSTTDYALLQASHGETYLNATSGQPINFRISNSTKMILKSDGNVGIGTTSPSALLNVEASADTRAAEISVFGTATQNKNVIIKQGHNNTSRLWIGPSGFNTDALIRTSGNGLGIRVGGSTTDIGTDALHISSTGNVRMYQDLTVDGIVTAQEFHTTFVSASIIYQSGSTQFGDTSDDTHIFSGSITQHTSPSRYIKLKGGTGDLEVVSDNNTTPVAYIKGTGTADLLNVYDNTTEVFTILDGGNVGINKTSPTEKLDVAGNAKAYRFISSNSSTNGVFQLAYSDQHKKQWTTSLDFSYTSATTYNFNLIFRNSGGYHYDLTATTSRSGLYRNFGTLKDSSHIYWESDGDFAHRAEGDIHLISNYSNGMYFSADTTSFLSDSKTGTAQNGSSNWSYYIVRYSIYIPYYVGDTTGTWKLHLTTYGDTGGNAPEFVLA